MKRLLVLLLTICFMLFPVISEAEETLTIKAYKTGGSSTEPYLVLYAIDSITDGSQLENIDSVHSGIDLDEFVDNGSGNLLGTLPSGTSSDGLAYGNIVFSYRAEGNFEGKFEVTTNIESFEYTDDLGKSYYIDAYYEPKNKSIGFNTGNSPATITESGVTVSLSSNPSHQISRSRAVTPGQRTEGSVGVTFLSSWEVSDGSNSTEYGLVDETWIVREAMYLILKESGETGSFESAPDGTYRALVTMKLEVK